VTALIQLAIRQPITVMVGVIAAFFAGLIALDRVPIAMTPEVESPVIAVTTRWENATPADIEQDVIKPQEEKLQGVANLVSMTSTSSFGEGQIRLEFRTGTDKDAAMQEVSIKIEEVERYPENVDQPVIENTDPESRDYIAWVVLTSSDPGFDIRHLQDFAEQRVKPRFERLPGVSEVNVLGGMEREARVVVDPQALAVRGITMSQFYDALASANVDYSGGAVDEGMQQVRVRGLGRFSSPEAVKGVTIVNTDAGRVLVGDVADVVETFKEQTGYVAIRGIPCLAINFQREIGSNVLEVLGEIEREIEKLNAEGGLLAAEASTRGIDGTFELVKVYDQTSYIDQALALVRSNILIGGLLATVTLLLFLRSLRSVGIIAIAIPISIMGSLVVLVALGRSINVISLAGLAFAIGMVVDNAIVVLENIYRHLEMNKSPRKAALDGTREVGSAVVASTATTLIVFIPVLMIEQTAGQLFRDIALAIMAAVALSLIVSVTVIPSASRLLLKRQGGDDTADLRDKAHAFEQDQKKPDGKMPKWAKAIGRGLRAMHSVKHAGGRVPRAVGGLVYRLTGAMAVRLAVIAVFVVVCVGGTILLLPPIDYLPNGNRNIVFGLMFPPPGWNFEQKLDVLNRVEARVRPYWEVEPAVTEAERRLNGKPSTTRPAPVPVMTPGAEGPPTMVQPPPLARYFAVIAGDGVFHGAVSADDETAIDMQPLFGMATAQTATSSDVIAFAFQLPLFRTAGTSGSAIQVDLSGQDLDQVSGAAGALFGTLMQEYGPGTVRPDPFNFSLPTPEVHLRPDDDALREAGLTRRDWGLTVAAAGDGAFAGEYQYPDELKDLKILYRDDETASRLQGLANVAIATPFGPVDLGAVSLIDETRSPDQIKRVGRQRAITLEVDPPRGVPLGEAVADLEAKVASLREAGAIPPAVQVDMAGSAGALAEIRTALLGDGTVGGTVRSSLFIALAVVYLLMCVLFQSWTYPLVIMVSVPLATFGGFLALALVHYWSVVDRYMPVQNLDVLTILGFVILAGVVVNNAILIVVQALNYRAGTLDDCPDGGLPPREAIRASVESRVRPILMSTMTSVGGMLPLVLMPGAGSELYRGLGSVVVGGLLVSTIFTLVLVPVVLSLVFDLEVKLGRNRAGGDDDAGTGGGSDGKRQQPKPGPNGDGHAASNGDRDREPAGERSQPEPVGAA